MRARRRALFQLPRARGPRAQPYGVAVNSTESFRFRCFAVKRCMLLSLPRSLAFGTREIRVVEITKQTLYTVHDLVRFAGVVQESPGDTRSNPAPLTVSPGLPEAANAMQPFPTLTPQARRLLEILVRTSAIDGSTLMKQMEASGPADIVTFVHELQKYDLIEVGGALTDDRLPFAQFAVRPSAKEYLHSMLRNTA